MLRSLLSNTSEVAEVLVATISDTPFEERSTQDGVSITQFGFTPPCTEVGHALGLHECIDRAETEFLMLSDPDIVFRYKGFDEHYLNLYRKHNLGIIGIGHHRPDRQAYGDFPCVTNCLVKKSHLPDESFLKGELTIAGIRFNDPKEGAVMDGKYLLQGSIDRIKRKFPNYRRGVKPEAPDRGRRANFYDCGCNLWYWNERKGRNWLSFPQQVSSVKNLKLKGVVYKKRLFSVPLNKNRNNFGFRTDGSLKKSPTLLDHVQSCVIHGRPETIYDLMKKDPNFE